MIQRHAVAPCVSDMPKDGPRKTGIEANGAGARLRRTVRCLIAVTVAFGFLESIGGCVADTDEMKLNWEWPAGRMAEIRVLVRVTKVEKEGKGPLGIGQSPSMGSHLPDATVLRGEIVGRPKSSVAEGVVLRLPMRELPEVAPGEVVGLGITGGSVCICIGKVPADLHGESAKDWLSSMKCG